MSPDPTARGYRAADGWVPAVPTLARSSVPGPACLRRARGLVACAAVPLALAWAQAASAQIYASVAQVDGTIVLSNFQTREAPDLLLPGPELTPPASVAAVPTPTPAPRGAPIASKASPELRRLIDSIALQVQLPSELLHAVIAVESNYDPKAHSPKGAIGLMQLLPATAQRFGAKDPWAAADNLLAGASYLKWLMGLFGDDLALALAAYNSGEQAVLRAGRKIPPFAETQAYVPRVLAQLQNAPAPRR
jgi:soluble lytic murein transglycosylase-like protein